MSTGNLKPGFNADRHPDENQLLLALEREVPEEEIAEVERHLGTCWNCRARYHEMQRGILTFVEYREKVYLPSLESAPRDFRAFPYLLKSSGESREPGMLVRIRTRLSALIAGLVQVPINVKWVSATATVMIAVLLWTLVLNPTPLPASELLIRAVRAQNPPAKHLKVRQKVRMKTGKTESVREFDWETGGPIPNAGWESQIDPEHWSAPLTAEGFAQWHDSLTGRKDKVKKSANLWTLETTVASGPIRKASIVIHDVDFRPTEEHILFADERRLDVEEVSFDVGSAVPAAVEPSAVAVPAPRIEPRNTDTAIPATVNLNQGELDEAELELRYTLFTHHWDEGEDLQIVRATDAVVVSGAASSAERTREMQATLASLPGVRITITAPVLAAGGKVPSALKTTAASSAVPLLKDALDRAFASAAARRDFVDDCLLTSDSALAHAWALRKLAERYTDADVRRLKPESQTKLGEMLRGHLRQLVAANTTLNGLLDYLPQSLESRSDNPVATSAGALALLDLVQQQDFVVAALVAGTQAVPQTAVAAADRFRAAHAGIARVAAGLKLPGMQ